MKNILIIQDLVEDILIVHGIKGKITSKCFEIDDSIELCINYIFYITLEEHYPDECLLFIQDEANMVAEAQGFQYDERVPENVVLEWGD